MKNLILPFLVAVLLGLGACDDSTINPPDDKKDTTNKDTTKKDTTVVPISSIKEDIIGTYRFDDSLGNTRYAIYAVNKDGSGGRRVLPHTFKYSTHSYLSPDKTTLIVLESKPFSFDYYLYKIHIDSNTIDTVDIGYGFVGWMPDSKFFIYRIKLSLYLSDGKTKTAIGDINENYPTIPIIVPDGNRLIFHDKNSIYSTNKFGQNKTTIVQLNNNESCRGVLVSSTGQKIAFVKYLEVEPNNNKYKLVVANINGDNQITVGSSSTNVSLSDWSTDESKFLVVTGASEYDWLNKKYIDYTALRALSMDGKVLYSFGEWNSSVYGGSWSKNGQDVLFTKGPWFVSTGNDNPIYLSNFSTAQWVNK